jgi:hypothetical protein
MSGDLIGDDGPRAVPEQNRRDRRPVEREVGRQYSGEPLEFAGAGSPNRSSRTGY